MLGVLIWLVSVLIRVWFICQMMLIGRVSHDGRVTARVKCDLLENLCLKINAQVFCLEPYEPNCVQYEISAN